MTPWPSSSRSCWVSILGVTPCSSRRSWLNRLAPGNRCQRIGTFQRPPITVSVDSAGQRAPLGFMSASHGIPFDTIADSRSYFTIGNQQPKMKQRRGKAGAVGGHDESDSAIDRRGRRRDRGCGGPGGGRESNGRRSAGRVLGGGG